MAGRCFFSFLINRKNLAQSDDDSDIESKLYDSRIEAIVTPGISPSAEVISVGWCYAQQASAKPYPHFWIQINICPKLKSVSKFNIAGKIRRVGRKESGSEIYTKKQVSRRIGKRKTRNRTGHDIINSGIGLVKGCVSGNCTIII